MPHLNIRVFSLIWIKMSRIISVSRRTDIPAYYGGWFMNRLKEGFSGYVNPFGRQKYLVSLKPEDVVCFVFWSKNFNPFLENLRLIEAMGYSFYFNYTITGLPAAFESNTAGKEVSIEALKVLGKRYSPAHINWRYDPITISDITDFDFHINNFKNLAAELEGCVERCYFSYAVRYGKVKTNFKKFQADSDIEITDPDSNFRYRLANELASIAQDHGIEMHSCCGDYLLNPKIKKAHCIDGKLVEELMRKRFSPAQKPTRKECGCTESTDIGAYDTCPHGCIYCYANMNKEKADVRFKAHDDKSAFLGYAKAECEDWVKALQAGQKTTLLDFA